MFGAQDTAVVVGLGEARPQFDRGRVTGLGRMRATLGEMAAMHVADQGRHDARDRTQVSAAFGLAGDRDAFQQALRIGMGRVFEHFLGGALLDDLAGGRGVLSALGEGGVGIGAESPVEVAARLIKVIKAQKAGYAVSGRYVQSAP